MAQLANIRLTRDPEWVRIESSTLQHVLEIYKSVCSNDADNSEGRVRNQFEKQVAWAERQIDVLEAL